MIWAPFGRYNSADGSEAGFQSSLLPVGPNKALDLGIDLSLPSPTVEYAKMTDFRLKVMTFLGCRNAYAEAMGGHGLARRANIVSLALNRHQGGALYRSGFD